MPTLLGDVDQPAPHDLKTDGVALDARHRLVQGHARRHHGGGAGLVAYGQAKVEEVVDGQGVAGRHDGCRFPFLDDGRPFDALARRERVAVVDRHLDEASGFGEIGPPLALERRAAGRLQAAHLDLGRRARAQHPPIKGLHRGSLIEMGVQAFVLGIESGLCLAQTAGVQGLRGQGHVDLAHLPEIAHLGVARHRHVGRLDPGVDEKVPALHLKLGKQVVDGPKVHVVQQTGQGTRKLKTDRRNQESKRRRRPRRRRNDDLADAQLARHPRRMGRTGAAHRHHRVAPGVAAFLDDVDPGRARHALADDVVDAPRRFDRGQGQRFGDPRQGRLGRLFIQAHAAAEEERRVQIAQKKIGVGHRRLRPAPSIARRPRVGAGASRSHLEQAQLIEPGDRAAAGANLDHVNHRRLDGQAAALFESMDARRFQHRRHVRLAVLYQAGLGRRAPHVEGDHVGLANPAAEEGGRQTAPRRARFEKADRIRCRRLGRDQATGRLHEVELSGEALIGEGRDQTVDVALHQRLDIGVGGRRRGALILPQLGLHVAGQRDRDLWMRIDKDVARQPLVGRVFVSMKETDGDRLDARRRQVGRFPAHLIEIERHHHVAVAVQALVDFAAQGARRQGLGKFQKQVVDVVALLDSHLQDVAEPPGRQQGQLGAAALDDGVGDKGRAVDQVRDVGCAQTGAGEKVVQSLQRAKRGIIRRRQALVNADLGGVRVVEHEIGERAANIEADAIAPVVSGHQSLPTFFSHALYRAASGRRKSFIGGNHQPLDQESLNRRMFRVPIEGLCEEQSGWD